MPSSPPCMPRTSIAYQSHGSDIHIITELFEVPIEVFDMGLHIDLSHRENTRLLGVTV